LDLNFNTWGADGHAAAFAEALQAMKIKYLSLHELREFQIIKIDCSL
jgi:hypothetical protein